MVRKRNKTLGMSYEEPKRHGKKPAHGQLMWGLPSKKLYGR